MTLRLRLADGADGPGHPGAPTVAPRHVWGTTPAWHAALTVGAEAQVEASFVFVPSFVRGLGPSEAASRRWMVRAALRMALGVGLAAAGGLLLHGAGLLPQTGRALAFLGPSGAGKSTMARRVPDAVVLADDVVAVWPDAGGWWVSGTPLRGREGAPTLLEGHPLAGIVALRPHAEHLALATMSTSEGLGEVMRRTCLDADPAVPPAVVARVLDAAAALSDAVPAFTLASSLHHAVAPAIAAACAGQPWSGAPLAEGLHV